MYSLQFSIRSTRSKFLAAALLSVAQFQLLAVAARAHSDVFLSQTSGQVAVGGANELGTVEENFDLTTRVFAGVMISSFPPFSPADYGRDEPGFVALANGNAALPLGATALTASSPVTLQLSAFTIGSASDTLFYWNGSGAVNFQPISTAQPGVAMSLDPNPIGTTSTSGALHEHPVFMLDNGAAGVPADGVYLIAPTARVAGLTDSSPFYMLWLVDSLLNDEDAAEGLEDTFANGETMYLGKDFGFFPAAASYAETNVVPEPTIAALCLLGLAGFAGVIRRRPSTEVQGA